MPDKQTDTRERAVELFLKSFLSRITPEIMASFSETQIQAIHNAVRLAMPFKKHPVDVRGLIPVFFMRFYFVLLMGRDRRTQTRELEASRGRKASLLVNIIFILIAASPLILILIIVLYILKSVMGFDLNPNIHFPDFLMKLFL